MWRRWPMVAVSTLRALASNRSGTAAGMSRIT
jgi:hypothetical protein